MIHFACTKLFDSVRSRYSDNRMVTGTDVMPERFSETMRAASEAGWSHAVQHRFVNELFAGAVPDAVMAL